MKQRSIPAPAPAPGLSLEINDRISLRLEQDLTTRLHRVVEKSKRSKTSIIEECLEKALPELEKQYAKAA